MEVVGSSTESLIMMRAASALRLFEIELAIFVAPSEGGSFLDLVFINIRAIST